MCDLGARRWIFTEAQGVEQFMDKQDLGHFGGLLELELEMFAAHVDDVGAWFDECDDRSASPAARLISSFDKSQRRQIIGARLMACIERCLKRLAGLVAKLGEDRLTAGRCEPARGSRDRMLDLRSTDGARHHDMKFVRSRCRTGRLSHSGRYAIKKQRVYQKPEGEASRHFPASLLEARGA